MCANRVGTVARPHVIRDRYPVSSGRHEPVLDCIRPPIAKEIVCERGTRIVLEQRI